MLKDVKERDSKNETVDRTVKDLWNDAESYFEKDMRDLKELVAILKQVQRSFTTHQLTHAQLDALIIAQPGLTTEVFRQQAKDVVVAIKEEGI